MNLSDLKQLLAANMETQFQIALPDGSSVPQSFHVTEVGRIHKTFIDCGGTLRELISCQLQVWVGHDYDHRVETKKMAGILKKAETYLPDEAIPVEIEYEDRVISQYIIDKAEISSGSIVLHLAHKHTECLAPDICGITAFPRLPEIPEKSGACSPSSGCC